MASSVEQIKSKLSIVEVVGPYLKLEQAGANYRACCPFHNEKTPSFFVSPARGTYHCFGCNRGGDLIAFVQEIEGLDFLDALKSLADRAGIELKAARPGLTSANQRLLTLLEEATNFYFKQLTETPEALAYLLDRGLTKETIKTWRLGFALEAWRHLGDYLSGRGYREEEMVAAGLSIKPAEQTQTVRGGRRANGYDRFRNRLMFPLFDPAGRPVGFSGRIFPLPSTGSRSSPSGTLPSESRTGQAGQAKYINTPQTEVYDKSSILYGYDRAKLAIRQNDYAVFVEGQFDLLLAHQTGTTNTVAVSGTALTENHLRLVKRLTERVILAYDYDLAGLSASRRAINLLRAEDFEVRIAKLPSGSDPADVIKDNPATWTEALAEAKHYIDFMIDALLEEGKTGLDLNSAVNTHVLPYLKALPKKMEQAHFVAKLSRLLRIEEAAVWTDLASLPAEEGVSAPASTPEPTTNRLRVVEERLFGLYFLLLGQGQVELGKTIPADLIETDIFEDLRLKLEPIKDRLALAAELVYDPESDLVSELTELARQWQTERLKNDQADVLTAIQEAERSGNETARNASLQKYRDLTAQINSLKK